jgi:hypothetical protein
VPSNSCSSSPVSRACSSPSSRWAQIRISLHFSGDKLKRALRIGEVGTTSPGLHSNQIALLMDRYSVSMCAVDSLPETRMARGLQARSRAADEFVPFRRSNLDDTRRGSAAMCSRAGATTRTGFYF